MIPSSTDPSTASPSFPGAPAADPIDPTTASLLALFSGPLQGVRFPDVDGEVLTALADAVRASAGEVTAARASLVAAQAALGAAEQSLVADEQALLVRCQRALAYAHVYAAGNPVLRDALDAIHASSGPASSGPFASRSLAGAAPSHAPPVSAAPRRRGRPRKHPEPEVAPEAARPVLFAANDAEPLAASPPAPPTDGGAAPDGAAPGDVGPIDEPATAAE